MPVRQDFEHPPTARAVGVVDDDQQHLPALQQVLGPPLPAVSVGQAELGNGAFHRAHLRREDGDRRRAARGEPRLRGRSAESPLRESRDPVYSPACPLKSYRVLSSPRLRFAPSVGRACEAEVDGPFDSAPAARASGATLRVSGTRRFEVSRRLFRAWWLGSPASRFTRRAGRPVRATSRNERGGDRLTSRIDRDPGIDPSDPGFDAGLVRHRPDVSISVTSTSGASSSPTRAWRSPP